MTITARLSRTLHLAFGEDGAADMTTWMNTVDDHRSVQRELHELAMARIDARFERMDARFGEVEARLSAEFRIGLKDLEAKMDRRFADLLKWSFLFWCGTMAIVLLGRS